MEEVSLEKGFLTAIILEGEWNFFYGQEILFFILRLQCIAQSE